MKFSLILFLISFNIMGQKFKIELGGSCGKIGLQQIGAHKHLDLFSFQSSKVDNLTKDELGSFLKGEYFGNNSTRDKLKNDLFYSLDENIFELNSK